MSHPLRTAIVGLGKIAWRFDEESGRKHVWTHYGAYRAKSDRFCVGAVYDVSQAAAQDFSQRHPNVRVMKTIDDIVAYDPEVVSICTPVDYHAAALERVLAASSLRVIWCEKPLAGNLDDAEHMVAACRERGIALVVSHVRRWVPLWRRAAERVIQGDIGHLRMVRVSMPNRLWSIGSHAVDLAVMLGGTVTRVQTLDVAALVEDGEPARPALLEFENGAYGVVEVTGLKNRLIVEAEMVGDAGRLRVSEGRGEISFEPFGRSGHYDGYYELGAVHTEAVPTFSAMSPFLETADEVAALAGNGKVRQTCSGEVALQTMRVLQAMAA